MSLNQDGAAQGEGSSEADIPTRLMPSSQAAGRDQFNEPTVGSGPLGPGGSESHSPASPPADNATAVSDNKLGSYRLERRLGVGGMGEVFLGTDIHLERSAAIKVIRRDFAEVPGALDRLKVEAQAAARLQHPNIVSVYQFGEEAGRYFIAFEYVPGRDLARVVDEDGPMEAMRALRIIRQAALALRYAAENKIIHRDIKPSNLILLAGDVVKVADFGLAKRLDADSKLTKTDMVVGSPSYMSPEQGLGKALDFRADIYSLGCTLFALLMGEAPYSASTPLAVMMHHANSAIPEPEKLKKAMDGKVVVLLRKMLAKRALERHASYDQLISEIDELIGPAGGAKHAPKAMTYLLHGVLPGLLILAVGLGVAWGIGQRMRQTPKPVAPMVKLPSVTTAVANDNPASMIPSTPEPVAPTPPPTPSEIAVAAPPPDRAMPIAEAIVEGDLREAFSVAMRARDLGRLINDARWDEAETLGESIEAQSDLTAEEVATMGRLVDCIDLARVGEERFYDLMDKQTPFELKFFAGPVRFVGVQGETIVYEAPPGSASRQGTLSQLDRPDRHLLCETVYRNANLSTVDELFPKALFLLSVAPHTDELYFNEVTGAPGFDERGAELRTSWVLWKNVVQLGGRPPVPGASRNPGGRPGPPIRPLRREQGPPPRRN